MSGSDIINLNTVARPDLRVELGHDENGAPLRWRLPHPDSETIAQLTVLFEEFARVATESGDDADPLRVQELSVEIREVIEGLFAERQPAEAMEQFPRLTVEQSSMLYRSMVEVAVPGEEEAEEAGEEGGERPTSSTAQRRRSAAPSPAKSQPRTQRRGRSVTPANS